MVHFFLSDARFFFIFIIITYNLTSQASGDQKLLVNPLKQIII